MPLRDASETPLSGDVGARQVLNPSKARRGVGQLRFARGAWVRWCRTLHVAAGWLSLLLLAPVVNLIVLHVIAFARWPARRVPDLPV